MSFKCLHGILPLLNQISPTEINDLHFKGDLGHTHALTIISTANLESPMTLTCMCFGLWEEAAIPSENSWCQCSCGGE